MVLLFTHPPLAYPPSAARPQSRYQDYQRQQELQRQQQQQQQPPPPHVVHGHKAGDGTRHTLRARTIATPADSLIALLQTKSEQETQT